MSLSADLADAATDAALAEAFKASHKPSADDFMRALHTVTATAKDNPELVAAVRGVAAALVQRNDPGPALGLAESVAKALLGAVL